MLFELKFMFRTRIFIEAFEAAGRNKFFKVKYFTGALSYGTKIQSGHYAKKSYNICMLCPRCDLNRFMRLFLFNDSIHIILP
jgi:hypothetical protein